MAWKSVFADWFTTVFAIILCVAGYFLHSGAYCAGYGASALGLLGWHFLRFVLLLVAWLTVVSTFKDATAKKKPGGLTVLEGASAVSIFVGCMGCYPLWSVVLLLTIPLFIKSVISLKSTEGRLPRVVMLRFGIAIAVFLPTWYLCASTTRQAMQGLGDRIEAKGGSDKLVAWAKEVIETDKQRQQAVPVFGASAVALMASPQGEGPLLAAAMVFAGGTAQRSRGLEPDEIPAWVDDLLGPFQGVRSVMVEDYGYGPCVSLRTGGSAFHFRISVCPNRVRQDPPPWWWGELAGWERHGVSLETEGK